MRENTPERLLEWRGKGNIHADLGYPDAEEMLVKAQLVTKIAEIVRLISPCALHQ